MTGGLRLIAGTSLVVGVVLSVILWLINRYTKER